MIRIANGQGHINYLTLDYLAEITMSIVQRQKQADPARSHVRDFPLRVGSAANEQGPLDCLGEITMSIVQNQKQADARDFPSLIASRQSEVLI